MKSIFLLLLFSSFYFSAAAQCSITKRSLEDGATAYEAKFEKVYESVGENNNGDYGAGLEMAYARVFKHWDKAELTGAYGLQIGVAAKPSSRLVIPRQVTITFSDGTSLSLSAASYREEDGIHICTFVLDYNQLRRLSSQARSVLMTDNRTGKFYNGDSKTGLYSGVLSEQVQCLLSSASSSR